MGNIEESAKKKNIVWRGRGRNGNRLKFGDWWSGGNDAPYKLILMINFLFSKFVHP